MYSSFKGKQYGHSQKLTLNFVHRHQSLQFQRPKLNHSLKFIFKTCKLITALEFGQFNLNQPIANASNGVFSKNI